MSDDVKRYWVDKSQLRENPCLLQNGSLISGDTDVYLGADYAALQQQLEQAQVQLAGCGVAALGGIKDQAKKGDYGWSPAYQDVMNLRIRAEHVEAELVTALSNLEEQRRLKENAEARVRELEAAVLQSEQALATEEPAERYEASVDRPAPECAVCKGPCQGH